MGYDHLHILNVFSKLYFVADLKEWYFSLANMPEHKSRGHKLGEKRKENKTSPSQGCAGGQILSEVGVIYPPHHKLQSFQHTRPRGITSHSHNDRGRWL